MEDKELTITVLAKKISVDTGVTYSSVLAVLNCLTTRSANEVLAGGKPDADSPTDFCLWEASRSKVDHTRGAQYANIVR